MRVSTFFSLQSALCVSVVAGYTFNLNDFNKNNNVDPNSLSSKSVLRNNPSSPFGNLVVDPNSLSQKSVMRQAKQSLMGTTMAGGTVRYPMRMPSQSPMVPYMPPGADYAQFIDIEAAMYKDRTIMISKFIDDQTANNLISILLYLRKENYRDPISLYFNCPGGWLRPSLAVYDLIQNTKQNCAVETVNLGICAGMGAILCSSGTKGRRSAMPNARFLLQRTGMDKVFQGQATDIALEVRDNKKWNDRMELQLASLTGQKVERIQQDLKRDFYLSSDEAVQYGLIDKVLLPSPRKRAAQGDDVAELGAFEGEQQRYQNKNAQAGGGWGSRTAPENDNIGKKDDDDDDEPKTQK